MEDLTVAEINWFFPVVEITTVGSTLTQVTEDSGMVEGTGVNGLAVGWRRRITTSRRIDPVAPGAQAEPFAIDPEHYM